ncbi:MAG: translation initiation factor IF-3 [Myxococcota bacterium]|nr:translation initiation factor IF-3 [Myxococcota bacterium]
MRKRSTHSPAKTGTRKNLEIRVPRVLVIDETGKKIGILSIREAIAIAQQKGLDLVEVAPNAKIPVCKIADYGRLMYEKKKKDSKAKKKQTVVSVKEVKLTPKTDEHDFQVKLKHARRFLESGDKVKVTIRFRGREMAHRELGDQQCLKLKDALGELCIVESKPNMEGRQLTMILAPNKLKK